MVSVGPDSDTGSNSVSLRPSITADGRFVAFESNASNLVDGDTNRRQDIFVRDLARGRTVGVSRRSTGGQSNGYSFGAAISADGRYVAFESDATNLVPGDTNHRADIFVRDLVAKTTERVSVSSADEQGNGDVTQQQPPAISDDGRFVAFVSEASNLVGNDTNGDADAFVHDRVTGTTTRVSVSSTGVESRRDVLGTAWISGDGTVVAFTSFSPNLVPHDTNGTTDVFLHDRTSGSTTRASVSSAGVEADGPNGVCGLSDDGLHAGFYSSADNLVEDDNQSLDVFVRNLG